MPPAPVPAEMPAMPALTAPRESRAGLTRLSSGACTGFSLGMIGERIFRDAPALLLMIFMTNYLAIPPAMAGIAIFIPKLLIIFVDPLVGTFSDRLQTRWGRRLPVMFVGSFLTAGALVAFFHVPELPTPAWQAAYMSLTIFIGFAGYSLFSVPYLSMASEIAADDEQRRRVMSFRIAFMAIGLSVSAFGGGFVEALGGDRAAYSTMAWVYAGICLATMLTTVFVTGRIPVIATAGTSIPLREQFRALAASHRYLRLLQVGFLQKVGEGIGYGSFAYFCIYVVQQPLSGIGLVVLAATAGQILSQPLWLRASRRWSGETLYAVGVFGWCLNIALWLAMKGQSQWWLLPLGLQGGIAVGGFLMVTMAMFSSVVAQEAAETGVNREGVYSGLWLAMEKLAFAFGTLIVGVMLAITGFVESVNGAPVAQAQSAVLGIAFTYVAINVMVYLVSVVSVRRLARLSAAPAT